LDPKTATLDISQEYGPQGLNDKKGHFHGFSLFLTVFRVFQCFTTDQTYLDDFRNTENSCFYCFPEFSKA